MLQAEPYRSERLSFLLDAIALPGPELQQRAMPRFTVLLQPGSVLMGKVPATIENNVDAYGLGPC